ncbi:hypothetical protein [Myxosarcina sp. GI1(2024)]
MKKFILPLFTEFCRCELARRASETKRSPLLLYSKAYLKMTNHLF